MDVKNIISLNLFNRLRSKIFVVLIIFLVLVISVLKLYSTTEVNKNASLEEFTAYLDERL